MSMRKAVVSTPPFLLFCIEVKIVASEELDGYKNTTIAKEFR